jgi:hypothetical protein
MITSAQYKTFLDSIITELEGDWVIIGGSLLALVNADNRATADIDLCSVGDLDNDKRVGLMKLTEKAGLSIESINPAADFFLKQIPNWKNSIVILQHGAKGSFKYKNCRNFEIYLKKEDTFQKVISNPYFPLK